MKYYTIQKNSILIADNETALTRYYDNVFELPQDYEEEKYIIGDVEKEIDVPDYETLTDDEGNEYEAPIYNDVEETITVPVYDEETGEQTGEEEQTIINKVLQTHKETIIVKGLVLNPDWETIKAQKEAERIAQLHLTRGDVFRGLLQAKGVTRAQLRAIIEALPEETNEQSLVKEMALIDFDEALEFYRGVSLIETVGQQLGITTKQMDNFFETNDYHALINEEE